MRSLRVLSAPHSVEILKALVSGPKRFSNLSGAAPHDRTRARRLRELRELGLVQGVPVPAGGREVLAYSITDRGRAVLRRVADLEKALGG